MANFKFDIGLTVANGIDGQTFLNQMQNVSFRPAGAVPTFDEMNNFYSMLATNLNLVFKGTGAEEDTVIVNKMNFPIYSHGRPTVSAVPVHKIVFIARILPTDGVGNADKISGAIVGVPQTVNKAAALPGIRLLLRSAYGFCDDGLTERFVDVVYCQEKSISKE